ETGKIRRVVGDEVLLAAAEGRQVAGAHHRHQADGTTEQEVRHTVDAGVAARLVAADHVAANALERRIPQAAKQVTHVALNTERHVAAAEAVRALAAEVGRAFTLPPHRSTAAQFFFTAETDRAARVLQEVGTHQRRTRIGARGRVAGSALRVALLHARVF